MKTSKPELTITWNSAPTHAEGHDGAVLLDGVQVARLAWERGLFWNAYVDGVRYPIRGLVNEASTKFYVRQALKKAGRIS